MQPAQEKRQRDGRRMGDDVDARGIVPRQVFRLGEWRAQAGVRQLFGGAGEIDDRGAGLGGRQIERLAAGFRGAGQDDDAGILQAFGA